MTEDIGRDPSENELDIPLTLTQQVADLKRRITHLETLEGSGGALVALDKTELTVDAAIVTFASIAQIYIALKIIMYVRTDQASTVDGVDINFNNDVGANYDRISTIVRANDNFTTGQSVGGTAIAAREVAGDTTPANFFSPVELIIPNYANTINHKTLRGIVGNKRANSATNIILSDIAGFWRDVAAITEIDLTPSGGSNFKAGSNFYLFGITPSA